MKLRITKFEGILEADVIEGFLTIEDLKRMLIKNSETDEAPSREERVKPGNPHTGHLGAETKMPI